MLKTNSQVCTVLGKSTANQLFYATEKTKNCCQRSNRNNSENKLKNV